MLRNLKSLLRRPVEAVDGDIGDVNTFYFDYNHWMIRYLAADVGKWTNKKQVLISPVSFIETGMEAGRFSVNLTREQIEKSPEADVSKPITDQLEARIAAHYNWPRYWDTGTRAIGHGLESKAREKETGRLTVAVAEPVYTHDLMNAKLFFGFKVTAKDGAAGGIEDMIIDDGSWDIRQLVIDPGRLLPGKKVLVSPKKARRVDLDKFVVHVDMTKEEIKKGEVYTEE
jgi:hypothetical protein